MADVIIVRRSEENNTMEVNLMNMSQKEIYSFVENISELLIAFPLVKYYLVELQKLKISTKEIICAIMNQEMNKYAEYSIFELKS